MSADVAATQAALDDLLALVKDAIPAAAHDSAEEVQTRTQLELGALWHAPHTKTPSPPGAPPAAISGELAASVIVTDAGDSAFVGPTTVYGRIQELGGGMTGHPMMHWQEPPGVWHHSAHHDLPDRPYLKPAADSAIADGSIEQIFIDHVAAALAKVP